jgi:antibiotic biosynthesis monooxygenase (ABM) superfamily enzyme
MPVTYVVVTTKPAGAKFFNQFSDENKSKADAQKAWTATLPGFISQEIVDTSDNVRTFTIIWETVENYVSWTTQRKNTPFFIERNIYNKTNSITFDATENIT